jgi:hypothetical protein
VKQIRKRLTYANVMSSIAVFVVLGGAAVAASQLPKKSVGTKQLKPNAVTTPKLKKGAVTNAKLKDGAVTTGKLGEGAVTTGKLGESAVTSGKLAENAVTGGKIANDAVNGSKIADGSVSGADINAASAPFAQVIARIRGNAQLPFTGGAVYPLNNPTYVQPANESNQFVAGMEVTFAATCAQPRGASALLLVDPVNPGSPTISDVAGIGQVQDNGVGTVTRRMEFGPFIGGGTGMSRFAPTANTPHTFYVFLSGATCNSGSGVTASGAGVDVLGLK